VYLRKNTFANQKLVFFKNQTTYFAMLVKKERPFQDDDDRVFAKDRQIINFETVARLSDASMNFDNYFKTNVSPQKLFLKKILSGNFSLCSVRLIFATKFPQNLQPNFCVILSDYFFENCDPSHQQSSFDKLLAVIDKKCCNHVSDNVCANVENV
jgi:hypothetical protein